MSSVDIVLRTRDRPLFLARALDDVLAQSFGDWTLILVNDGGDPTAVDQVVARRPALAGRVLVLHLPDATGRPVALRHGIDGGSAEFVAWHDDDDTWHPDFLTCLVHHLRTTDDLAVAARTQIVWERLVGDQLVETSREDFHPLMPEPTLLDLLRFNHVVSLVYRREVHEAIGSVDARLLAVADWEFYLRLWLAGPVGFVDGQPLHFWHQRPDSTGPAGNSVIADRASHLRYDRRVRDEALRAHGDGSLLYLSKYLDERSHEIHGRLDRLDAGQREAIALIGRLRG